MCMTKKRWCVRVPEYLRRDYVDGKTEQLSSRVSLNSVVMIAITMGRVYGRILIWTGRGLQVKGI